MSSLSPQVLSIPKGSRIWRRRQTHPLPHGDTSENSSPLTCKMGIKSLPHRARGDSGCSVRDSHPPALLPASPEQEEAGERQALPVSLLSCVSVEAALTPQGRQEHQLGPRRADPPSTPPLHGAQGERGREGAAWGPSHWQGWAWAWAPDNVLAQNYIRLEVSIFCSILLPDLIVHLWQCLYTSLLRTTRLPQQRVRANAEI